MEDVFKLHVWALLSKQLTSPDNAGTEAQQMLKEHET